MAIGHVIRSHSNLFYVLVDGRELECRPRGHFRLSSTHVLVGDRVDVSVQPGGEGRIDKVLPRRSELTRPAIANVDQAAIVYTIKSPETDRLLLDRFLVHAEYAGIKVLLVLGKIDLLAPGEAEAFAGAYGAIGYPVYPISALQGTGLPALAEALADQTTVLAGASGVGKSRLARALLPERQDVRVGELSEKLGRGRHTTRHVELMPLPGGGLLADSPGFTYLEFESMEKQQLADCFPEFRAAAGQCRFDDCVHRAEPGCRVRELVADGTIMQSRYDHYLTFLAEVEAQRKW